MGTDDRQVLSRFVRLVQASTGDHIPPFYFPGTRPVPEEVVRTAQESLQQLLAANPTGFAVAATKELVTQVPPGHPHSEILQSSKYYFSMRTAGPLTAL